MWTLYGDTICAVDIYWFIPSSHLSLTLCSYRGHNLLFPGISPKSNFQPRIYAVIFFFWWLLCTSKENWWLSVCIYHLSGKSLWPNITIMDTIKRVFENRSSSTLLEHRDSKGQIFKMNFFPSGQVFDAIIKMPFRTSTSHYQSASVQVTAPLWILSSCKCTTWEPGWEWFKHLGLCHLHGRPRMSSGLMPLAWPAPATIGI